LDQLAIGARADRTRRISLRRFALTASLALPKFDEPEGETGRSAWKNGWSRGSSRSRSGSKSTPTPAPRS